MGNPSEGNPARAGTHGKQPGGLASELQSARDGTIASLLSEYAMLQVAGEDAQAFLQGQLTCDVNEVTPTAARFGGYCTPQGRLLATFVLVRLADGYRMLLPAELAESLLARLRRYVLRSRVTLGIDLDRRAIGIAGTQAAAIVATSVEQLPRMPMEIAQGADLDVLRLPGQVFVALVPAAQAERAWQSIVADAAPVGPPAWDWIQVRAGIPWVGLATQDQFVPQMVGLDTIGGISFDKGCYPGQEIVARTHYLGEVKRRLARGHVQGDARAGDVLLSGAEIRGMVLNSAPSPDGGSELLAVVQASALRDSLRLREPAGPVVDLSPLPA